MAVPVPAGWMDGGIPRSEMDGQSVSVGKKSAWGDNGMCPRYHMNGWLKSVFQLKVLFLLLQLLITIVWKFLEERTNEDFQFNSTLFVYSISGHFTRWAGPDHTGQFSPQGREEVEAKAQRLRPELKRRGEQLTTKLDVEKVQPPAWQSVLLSKIH